MPLPSPARPGARRRLRRHQLLLAIRAEGPSASRSIGELADELMLRHHSAVGLVDRAEAAGLVQRSPDPSDHRVVRVALTPHGQECLSQLAALHVVELGRLGSQLADFARTLSAVEVAQDR